VISADAVLVLAGDGDADAVGDGLAEDTVVFELLGAGAQLVSKNTKKARNGSRRIMVMRVLEQRAFHRADTIYADFLNDLRTIRMLLRSVL
jgi:hypothetical protein